MSGAAKFGALLAVVASAGYFFVGRTVLFSVTGLLLTVSTIVVWQRTRLPLMTAGMATGVLVSFAIAVLDHYGASSMTQLPLAVGFAITFTLFIEIEKRWHPNQVAAWEDVMKHASLADILLLKHIPNLTDRSSGGYR